MRGWRAWLGIALAAAALAWVFHDLDLREVASKWRSLKWGWVAAAVVCDVASYLCEAARWRLLLRPAGELGLWRAVQAIYVGLFVNEVMPLRFGEVVRAWLVSRWTRLPLLAVAPSMAVARLLDGVWMAAGVGVVLILVPLPPDLERVGDAFGLAVAVLVAMFAWIAFHPPSWVDHWSHGGGSRPRRMAAQLLRGIGAVGAGGNLPWAAAYSLGLLVLQAAAFWLVTEASRLGLNFAQGAAVFLLVHLGTAAPNAPANVGTFQFFTVLGLQLFGVDKVTAAAFSLLVFVVLTVPLWALGAVAVARCGVSWPELRAAKAG